MVNLEVLSKAWSGYPALQGFLTGFNYTMEQPSTSRRARSSSDILPILYLFDLEVLLPLRRPLWQSLVIAYLVSSDLSMKDFDTLQQSPLCASYVIHDLREYGGGPS